MFEIYELYDVDGGIGDAIGKEKVIGYVETQSEAEEYVAKWSHPYIYGVPYDSLECQRLAFREAKLRLLSIDDIPMKNWDMDATSIQPDEE